MLKYIYLPSGRSVWIDVAEHLRSHAIGRPVLWAGDPVHFSVAQLRFQGVTLLRKSSEMLNIFGDSQKNPDLQILQAAPSLSAESDALYQLCRHPAYQRLRIVDSLRLVRARAAQILATVLNLSPDVLISAESPHSVDSCLLFGVCESLGIPTLHFQACGIGPFSRLQHGGVYSGSRPKTIVASDSSDLQLAAVQISVDRFMNAAEVGRPFATKGAKMTYISTPRRSAVDFRMQVSRRMNGDDFRLSRSETTLRAAFVQRPARALVGSVSNTVRNFRVEAEFERRCTSSPTHPYILFPMHFEPERTTRPDGGLFVDQLMTAQYLRSIIPAQYTIALKNHPAFRSCRWKNNEGRSVDFVRALHEIPGVELLSSESSNLASVRESAAVVTITGTSALEAASLGKPSVYLGNPWYHGFSLVSPLDLNLPFSTQLALRAGIQVDDFRGALAEFIRQHFGPLTLNPSTKKTGEVLGLSEEIQSRFAVKTLVSALQDVRHWR